MYNKMIPNIIINIGDKFICKKSEYIGDMLFFLKGKTYEVIDINDNGVEVYMTSEQGEKESFMNDDGKYKSIYTIWNWFYKPGELRMKKMKTIL